MYFDPDLGSDIVLQFVVGTAQIRTATVYVQLYLYVIFLVVSINCIYCMSLFVHNDVFQ